MSWSCWTFVLAVPVLRCPPPLWSFLVVGFCVWVGWCWAWVMSAGSLSAHLSDASARCTPHVLETWTRAGLGWCGGGGVLACQCRPSRLSPLETGGLHLLVLYLTLCPQCPQVAAGRFRIKIGGPVDCIGGPVDCPRLSKTVQDCQELLSFPRFVPVSVIPTRFYNYNLLD